MVDDSERTLMNTVNFSVSGPVMAHPYKRTITKLRSYECVHDNPFQVYAHKVGHSS